MKVTSPAFENGSTIPERFTCKGANVNPPLRLEEIPESTKSLCIVMHDPDSPSGDFRHWVGYDMEPAAEIPEGVAPGKQGKNDFGNLGYGGPCPPPGKPHRYVVEVHALDTRLRLPEAKTREEIEAAMQGHQVARAELTGTFAPAA